MTAARSVLARTLSGAGWVMAWRLGVRVLGVISTLILVRLLAPADFGLVAIASSFSETVNGMTVLGTEDAVIRHPSPSRSVYDTAFTLNALRSLAVTIFVMACAVPAAWFFGDPRLIAVLLVISLSPLLDGLSNIGTVDFRRDMQFQKEFAIKVIPKLFGITATITAALIKPSYTALLAGMMTNQIMRCIMSYAMHPFRPRLSLRNHDDLIGYSLWSWLLSLAMMIRDRSDMLMLGRLTNATSAGIYAIGSEIAALPTSELVEPLSTAAFAGFSAAHREGAAANETFLRVLGTAVLIVLPAGAGLSLVAAPLVRLAFGAPWDAAVPVLQVLAIAGTMTVFGNISLHLMSAHSLLGRLTAVVFSGAFLRVLLLLLLIPPLAATGAAWAVAISICLEQAMITAMATRRFGVSAIALAGQVWRPVFAAAAMAGVLLLTGLGRLPPGNVAPLVPLLLAIMAGATVYTAVLVLAWLAAGRPDGPEQDMLGVARRVIRR